MKSYLLLSLAEIKELQKKRLMGKIKPGLISNAIIACSIGDISTGFVIRNHGTRGEAQLLVPTGIRAADLEVMGLNCARTILTNVPVEVSLDPVYSASELEV